MLLKRILSIVLLLFCVFSIINFVSFANNNDNTYNTSLSIVEEQKEEVADIAKEQEIEEATAEYYDIEEDIDIDEEQKEDGEISLNEAQKANLISKEGLERFEIEEDDTDIVSNTENNSYSFGLKPSFEESACTFGDNWRAGHEFTEIHNFSIQKNQPKDWASYEKTEIMSGVMNSSGLTLGVKDKDVVIVPSNSVMEIQVKLSNGKKISDIFSGITFTGKIDLSGVLFTKEMLDNNGEGLFSDASIGSEDVEVIIVLDGALNDFASKNFYKFGEYSNPLKKLKLVSFAVASEQIDTNIDYFSSIEAKEIELYGATSLSDLNGLFKGNEVVEKVIFDGVSLDSKSAVETFKGCKNLKDISVNKLSFNKDINTSDLTSLFDGCEGLNDAPIDFIKLFANTPGSRFKMFYGCKNLQEIDLTGVSLLTSDNKIDVQSMFQNCSGLNKIDLNVTNISEASGVYNDNDRYGLKDTFAGCTNLEVIYCKTDLSSLVATNELTYNMFADCDKLVGNGTNRLFKHSDVDTNQGKYLSYARPCKNNADGLFTLGEEYMTFTFYTEKWGIKNPDPIKVYIGDTLYEGPEVIVPHKGLDFAYWFDDDPFVKFEFPYTATEDSPDTINLSAEWIITGYKIKYNFNGGRLLEGNTLTTVVYYEKGKVITLPTADQVYKQQYKFLGWYENGKKVETISKEDLEEHNLEAKWEPDYSYTHYLSYCQICPDFYSINGDVSSINNKLWIYSTLEVQLDSTHKVLSKQYIDNQNEDLFLCQELERANEENKVYRVLSYMFIQHPTTKEKILIKPGQDLKIKLELLENSYDLTIYCVCVPYSTSYKYDYQYLHDYIGEDGIEYAVIEPTYTDDSESKITSTAKVRNSYSGGGGGGGGGAIQKNDAANNQVQSVTLQSNPTEVQANSSNSSWQQSANGTWQMTYTDNQGKQQLVKDAMVNVPTVVTVTVNGIPTNVTVDAKYYFDQNGNMYTGWLTTADGSKLFFNTDAGSEIGKMSVGWKSISGNYYYFGQDGKMLSNTTTPDGYKVGADGVWVK